MGMIEQLETVLDRVIDWLKYEEAKNVALLTLDGAGLTLVWPNVSSAPTILVTLIVGGFMLGILVALASAYPIVLGNRVHDRMRRRHTERKERHPEWQPNVLYFGDIAGYDAPTYLSDFRAVWGKGDTEQGLALAYANEIITNSEIALLKLTLFKIGFCLAVFALVMSAASVLVR